MSYGRIIDARLHGERDRTVPRVFARPLTLQTGQSINQAELVARLNDVGYAQRARVERPGEFAIDRNTVVLISRGGDQAGKAVTVTFPEPPVMRKTAAKPPPPAPQRITKLLSADKSLNKVTLDAPLITAFMTGTREKRRRVALDAIPPRMQEAVLAIEDRRFYYHPGIDPIRIVGALIDNVFGNRGYLSGASTITQQLARNFFLTEEMAIEQQTRQRSPLRKVREQIMAVILETKATKDEILELYLNDVYLGHRGSFALHGVPEAAKMFFSKDVRNLSLSEAALIAGVIQSPFNHSPFNNPERAKDRRNVVLRAMADAEYITPDAAERATKEPVTVVARAVENEAPYFVDYLAGVLDTDFPGVATKAGVLDIYTTLDLNLQRYAHDALIARPDPGRRGAGTAQARAATGRPGRAGGDRSAHRRDPGDDRRALVQPVAVQPRRVGTPADRLHVQAVRLSRRLRAGVGGGPRPHPGARSCLTSRRRGSSTTRNGRRAITTRSTTARSRCGARWRCRATSRRSRSPSRPATTASSRSGRRPRSGNRTSQAYPSVALGTVEATPLELAEAYTVFPELGTTRKLRTHHQHRQRRGRRHTQGRARRQGRQARHRIPRHAHDAERA